MATAIEQQPTPLEIKLGWTFRNQAFYRKALTHATYANENPQEGGQDYERLEFLGDAVLDLIAARILFQSLTDAREGELSRRRARVVRRETLALLAQKLDLASYIRLGEGQKRGGGGASPRILADTYEALAGAVFLDGGYEAADRCFSGHIAEAINATNGIIDYKTQLQETCHMLGMGPPAYQVVEIDGPDHARRFTCEVVVDGRPYGRGAGMSKKAAEQVCASEAVEALQPVLNAKEKEKRS